MTDFYYNKYDTAEYMSYDNNNDDSAEFWIFGRRKEEEQPSFLSRTMGALGRGVLFALPVISGIATIEGAFHLRNAAYNAIRNFTSKPPATPPDTITKE